MSLLNKLTNQGSTLSGFNGTTPPTPDLQGSQLHNTYSINGQPNIAGKPQPSNLDLDGVTPPKYLDNLPS
jgi:hypothetical protein